MNCVVRYFYFVVLCSFVSWVLVISDTLCKTGRLALQQVHCGTPFPLSISSAKRTAAAQTRNSYLVRRAALKAEEAALAFRVMLNQRTASASSRLPSAMGGVLRGRECVDTEEEGGSCVHCLKALPLKMDEKYTEMWHLWSGKFAR